MFIKLEFSHQPQHSPMVVAIWRNDCILKITSLTDIQMYLMAPDAGFFRNKIVKSILNVWIGWNQQQQLSYAKSDPGGDKQIQTKGTSAADALPVSLL